MDANIVDDHMGPESVPMQDMGAAAGTETVNTLNEDVEDPNTVPEPKRPTLKEIFAKPQDYLSLICFMCCGGLGLIFALLAVTKAFDSIGRWIGCCLIILGTWSAYEIRLLAKLKKELNELQAVQEKLSEQVEKLTKEVRLYDEQNDRFKEETKELEEANADFGNQIEELSHIQNELRGAKEELETHRENLGKEKENLASSVESMQGNLQRLTEQTNELESQYEQFSQLQGQIQKYAKANGLEMGKALQKQNEMFSKLETVMNDNASTLLQQIATDMEFADDDEGMTKEEYAKWYARIPQRFRDQLPADTFDKFAGDDGVMQYEEMTSLIEDLLAKGSTNVSAN